jgi:hypothetical protein
MQIPPDSAIVRYTDGLVEGRRCDIDDGIRRLHAVLADADPDLPSDELAEPRPPRPRPEDATTTSVCGSPARADQARYPGQFTARYELGLSW